MVVVENCRKASWSADGIDLFGLPGEAPSIVRRGRYELRHHFGIPTIATLGKSLLGVRPLGEEAAAARVRQL